MSQLRIYRDGKPDWLPQGPATARVAGFGGSALGHFSGTTLAPGPQPRTRKRIPRAPLVRAPGAPRCGLPVKGEPCARSPLHADEHRTAEHMARDAARRRMEGRV